MAAEKAYPADAQTADSAGGLAQLDVSTWSSQIFWLVITFGLLYFVLARFILPKLDQGITNRADRIADDLDEAERMQQEAAQAEADYEQAVADAQAKAHNISETTRKSVDAELTAELEASESELARKQADADERIRKVKSAAMAKVDDVAADTIGAILDKVAGMNVTAASAAKAIAKAKE